MTHNLALLYRYQTAVVGVATHRTPVRFSTGAPTPVRLVRLLEEHTAVRYVVFASESDSPVRAHAGPGSLDGLDARLAAEGVETLRGEQCRSDVRARPAGQI